MALLAATPALAQVDSLGSLAGRVVDATTQQPVIGAIISFESIKDGQPRQQQKIGPTGAFRFVLLPGNGYHVQAEYYIRTEAAGYIPTKEKFITTSGLAIYTNRISGKTIYLTKGVAPKSSPVQIPLPTAPAPLTTAQTKPLATTPATADITTAGPVRTGPAATSVSSATARAVSTPTPPASITAQTRPVAPAPPVTVSTVQTQLRSMQFVQSKAELMAGAQPTLDQLLTFMQENPKVLIELAGHTDNQGNFEENLTLSRQRVELVKAFLVQHGIAASRISSRGYGSTRPIASNNSEATRRLNRRVEMIILTK